MITKLSKKPSEHNIEMEYSVIDNDPNVFVDINGNVLGYIWFNIIDKDMYVEMIEMVNKEEGLGTEAVRFLFENFDIEVISGNVLGESGMRAYWFWESLGGKMSYPMDEVENNIVTECYFRLNRNECSLNLR